ncbi:MAG: hypothetical protein IPK27_18965 [Rhodanobacteraceae bacterium]|nr:hypothetical protein [Rhodanobacteraceae bacterium]
MIGSPGADSNRAVWADWLEIEALFQNTWVGEALVRRTVGIGSDEQRLSDDDEPVEEEIADNATAQLLDRISDEIGFRSSALRENYPFEITRTPFSIRRRAARTRAHKIYLFNLLLSAVKENLISNSRLGDARVRQGRVLFHVCASAAVAALLHLGKTYWLGFPRPDRTGFLAALAELCIRIGVGQAHCTAPRGLPSKAKDDQVDVVGWRSFSDGRGAGLAVLCQAATGANWTEKSVAGHVDAFTHWFLKSPYARAWPAIAVPIMSHHELEESDGAEDFAEAQFNFMHRLNSDHGAVLDRLRIVEGTSEILKRDPIEAAESVAGYDRIGELEMWLEDALRHLEASH